MKVVIVAGPPATGKTSVLRHALPPLMNSDRRAMRLIKFDCLTGTDLDLYRSIGIDARLSLSGDFCPDHHFAVELGEAYLEARADDVELMIIETAGLCDRCSPFLDRIAAVAVLSLTASLQGPLRMRAIVEHADLVVLTRGELVSQAEREVFRATVRSLNPVCPVIEVNGLTGEGAHELTTWIAALGEKTLFDTERLRFPLPRGYCERCSGGI